MKIAIIGAGAAGMSTAYLLNKHHDITIFERQSIIGGNIRTLNKNVQGTQLDTNLILDCGVLEFQSGHFPNFHKLMNRLNITMAKGETSSELFLANGHCYKSGAGLMHHSKNFNEFLNEAQKLSPVVKGYMQFFFVHDKN
jgi:predicted NAD/FAD-binding protein